VLLEKGRQAENRASTYPIDLIRFTWYTRNQASAFLFKQEDPEMHPYYSGVPRHLAKPRPKQAARLVALRKAAGLSQAELAKLVRVSPKTIGFWETSAIPPRSDVLPLLAQALGVRVENILGDQPVEQRRPGPVGKLQRVFDEVSKLPRRQQDKILEFLSPIVEQYKRERKAS
jgi:transcriptional regulator with XRE-family HTH domain